MQVLCKLPQLPRPRGGGAKDCPRGPGRGTPGRRHPVCPLDGNKASKHCHDPSRRRADPPPAHAAARRLAAVPLAAQSPPMSADIFRDRRHAGQVLARMLADHAARSDLLVLALPRGGVPVGFEVAEALHAPLDVLIVRKLGVPGHEEYAMGAIASNGIRVLNEDAVQALGIDPAEIDAVARAERTEALRREQVFRGDRPAPEVHGRTVLLVDDGLATGSTMRVAVKALRARRPGRIVVGVPVAAAEACALLRDEADEVVCALTPEPFRAVGEWYEDFAQTSDEEVRYLLARARHDIVHPA